MAVPGLSSSVRAWAEAKLAKRRKRETRRMVWTAILKQPVTEEQRCRSQKPLQCSLPAFGLHISPSNEEQESSASRGGWRGIVPDGRWASLRRRAERGRAATERRGYIPISGAFRQVLTKYTGVSSTERANVVAAPEERCPPRGHRWRVLRTDLTCNASQHSVCTRVWARWHGRC